MQNSLKLPRFNKHKSNFTKGLTALVVLLPQALIIVAATEVEHTEFYIAVVVGTVAAALAISFLGKSFKRGCDVIPALTKRNRAATLLHHSQD